jgi:hypothetical protein
MISKVPALNIPDEEPFRHDALNRGESVEILTDLISTIEQPFVLAVESPFGMGKTTFLRMWRAYLRQKNLPVLYFNAWETDFTGDPLISFIGEMAGQIDSIGGTESKAKEYLSKAKDLAGTLAKKSLPLALKLATAGALDLDKLTETALADFAAKMAQERIDNYEADKTTIKGFKDRLAAFIKELSIDGTTTNVIVLIDELDRCRPNYAVEFLEKIKHFFNVNGLIFVLCVDRDQLVHSIRSLYGIGMDADGYLRRFIDLEYRLPGPAGEAFCKSLYQRFSFDDFFKVRKGEVQNDDKHLIEFFSELAGIFDLSLRVQEQIFTQLSIVLRTVKTNYFIYPIVLSTLFALKASAPELYRRFIERRADVQDVIEFIKSRPGGNKLFANEENRFGMELEAHLMAATHSERDREHLIERYQANSKNEKLPKRDREAAEFMFYFFSNFATRSRYGILSYLAKKIEMAERFIQSEQ